MQQFEDLMQSAATAGPSGSPLPLFYALSQAGRAVLASRHPEEEVVFADRESHGLAVPRDTVAEDDLLQSLVRPKTGDAGHFQRVARAVESPVLAGEAPLGAFLASLPEVGDELWVATDYARALPMYSLADLDTMGGRASFLSGRHDVALVADGVDTQDALDALLAEYPTLSRQSPKLPILLPANKPGRKWRPTPSGDGFEVQLYFTLDRTRVIENYMQMLDEIAPQYRWVGRRWVRPRLGGGENPPSPLMTWWAVLLALSSLARYHPVAWVRALQPDESPIATTLERTLDVALEALPHLLFDALHLAGSPLLLPPGVETPPVLR